MAARLNREQFEVQIQSGQLSLIDFYSDSCIPCKRLSPLLSQIESENPDIFIGKVNIAYDRDLAGELEVNSTPTLLFYKDGVQVDRVSGSVRKNQLEEIIAKHR